MKKQVKLSLMILVVVFSTVAFSAVAGVGDSDPGTLKTKLDDVWKKWAPIVVWAMWAGVALYGATVVYKFASKDRDAGEHLLYLGIAILITGALSSFWFA